MRVIKCGSQGLNVSRVGLGCMGMSGSYGPSDEAKSLRALHASLEAEMRFWDTADVYGGGANERLLSEVLKTYREQVILASKCGITGRNAEGLTLNGRPDYIHASCKCSLKRLGVEYLDLYYLHRVDPDVPIEESVGAIGELVSQGLVRYAGLSEAGANTIRRAHREFPLSALQSEYSLFTRDIESEILPLLRELEIGLVAYSPLGRGMLTGELELSEQDFRRQLPRFQGENLSKNLKMVERVQQVARNRDATPAQVALAWLLQHQDVIPIPGTKNPERVLENAASAKLELSSQELEALDFSSVAVAGDRYPDFLNRAVGR